MPTLTMYSIIRQFFPVWCLGVVLHNLFGGETHFLSEEEHPTPVFWPRKGRLWLCQLSHPAPHVTRARPPLGKELLPQGKLPSF